MRMFSIAATLLIVAGLGQHSHEVRAAVIDSAAYGHSARYLTYSHLPDEIKEQADTAQRWWHPHLTRTVALTEQTPVRIPAGDDALLYRIDLEALGWSTAAWEQLAKEYPYYKNQPAQVRKNPLILRGDWLNRITSDASQSKSYYNLLFGTAPANRGEWLKFLGIDLKQGNGIEQAVVLKAGASGVANDTRLVKFHPGARRVWETFDSDRAAGKSDPLEHGTDITFDAQELIAELPKVASVGKRSRSLTQAYFLTDGAGKRVDEAGSFVKDKTEFLHKSTIRTPGSCAAGCHQQGLNGTRENEVIEFLRLPGRPIIAVKKKRQQLDYDALFTGDIATVIRRQNEDVSAFALDHVGEDPRYAAKAWRDQVEWYEFTDLDLNQAAAECYATGNELRLAIGYWALKYGPQPEFARTSGLTDNKPVNRRAFEETVHYQCVAALALWRSVQ